MFIASAFSPPRREKVPKADEGVNRLAASDLVLLAEDRLR